MSFSIPFDVSPERLESLRQAFAERRTGSSEQKLLDADGDEIRPWIESNYFEVGGVRHELAADFRIGTTSFEEPPTMHGDSGVVTLGGAQLPIESWSIGGDLRVDKQRLGGIDERGRPVAGGVGLLDPSGLDGVGHTGRPQADRAESREGLPEGRGAAAPGEEGRIETGDAGDHVLKLNTLINIAVAWVALGILVGLYHSVVVTVSIVFWGGLLVSALGLFVFGFAKALDVIEKEWR